MRAAAALGPKQAMPAPRTASATPATSGTSGPITTRSAVQRWASAVTAPASVTSTPCCSETAAVPALPGAHASAVTPGSCASARTIACSRAPEPITRTRTTEHRRRRVVVPAPEPDGRVRPCGHRSSSGTGARRGTGPSTPSPATSWPSGWGRTSSSPTWSARPTACSSPATTPSSPGRPTSRPAPTSPTCAGPTAGSSRTWSWRSCAPCAPSNGYRTCALPRTTATTPSRRSTTSSACALACPPSWAAPSASTWSSRTRPGSRGWACRSARRCSPRSRRRASTRRTPR